MKDKKIQDTKATKNENQPLEREEMVPMQSVLYALAVKFLEQSELQQIREVLNMTILGQMLTEDARAEGRAEGMAELILELVRDLGDMPNALQERIMSERDLDKLHLWHRQAAKSTSMNEFLKIWQADGVEI